MTNPKLPSLPELGAPSALAALPKLMSLAEQAKANENPLDRNNALYLNDTKHDSALNAAVIGDEFAAMREARKKQAEAVERSNDSEFWCAVYFQTREQKEAFINHSGIKQDKYVDGQTAAAAMGIALPARPAPYKLGKVDRKLPDLT